MKVFVTGATGAVGPYTVRALIEAGHDVTALARTPDKAAETERLGATPVDVSLFDTAALAEAFTGHDAVVNLATSIPPMALFPLQFAWRANTRIRTEGSAAVAAAVIAAGVPRLVQESIAMAYPDRGSDWIDEAQPLDVVPIVRSTPIAEANAQRVHDAGGVSVVLRFGLFYGPRSIQSKQMLTLARLHVGLVLGPPNTYLSFLHLEDAGRAVAAALTAPSGVYNVVDDEPATKREISEAISASAGKRPWIRGPGRLAVIGGRNMAPMLRSMRVSNRKFTSATEWKPTYANIRDGWAATAAEIQRARSTRR